MKTVILLGPTAVGKTKLAIELAKEIGGEIISADSMQVYRGMDIGTAKPTIEERQGIPHHLIDIRNPDEEWTVSDFVRECQMTKSKIQMNHKNPIIVGGTGLYLHSLIEGYSFPIAKANPEIRIRLEQVPIQTLHSKLRLIDPEAANKINPNDKKRLVRALEVHELTGQPISKLQKERATDHSLRITDYKIIGLTIPREELYEKINQRVDQMIEQGLVEEVKGLLEKGYAQELKSFQALGYKEVIEYLNGNWSRDKMIEELKKRTRNFARRQMTWFKRFKNVEWRGSIVNEIAQMFKRSAS
ncbi:MAG: tRNA (adenosine(37)-N6)-dimethylallyltransferase MiaA [bacterium]